MKKILSHLKRKLEGNGLEAPDELQINTVTQNATKRGLEKPRQQVTTEKIEPLSCTVPSAQKSERLRWKQQKSADNKNIINSGQGNSDPNN